jgi:hypothetical protein
LQSELSLAVVSPNMSTRATRSKGHVSGVGDGPVKKTASAATKATKSTNARKPSKLKESSSDVRNAANHPKSKAAPKSLAIPTGHPQDSDDDVEPDNPPATVARKSPTKAGKPKSKAKTVISRMGGLPDSASDVDTDRESDAPNEPTTERIHKSRMVVEIPPFSHDHVSSSSSRPTPFANPAMSTSTSTSLSRPRPVATPVASTSASSLRLPPVATPVASTTSPPLSPVLSPVGFNRDSPAAPGLGSSPDDPNDRPRREQNQIDEGHADADSDVEAYRGGRFTQDQIASIRARCDAFFADLDTLAKDWRRSMESVRQIALASAPSKSQRNGNAWNAFQFSYRSSHPNTDPSGMHSS